MMNFFRFVAVICTTLSLIACSNTEENGGGKEPVTESYHLTATPLEWSEFAPFEDDQMRFILIDGENGTQTLLMQQVKFAEQMPRVTIDAPNIRLDKQEEVTLEVIIPRFNGIEMEQFAMSNFYIKADYDAHLLNVEFDCYTMHITYEGTLK